MLSSGRKNNCNFEELLACYYSYNALFNHFTFEYKRKIIVSLFIRSYKEKLLVHYSLEYISTCLGFV